MEKVRKRNGKLVDYDSQKIFDAIKKANADSKDKRMNKTALYLLVSQVEDAFENVKAPSVESIQDCIENLLMKSNWIHTAKSYIVYRNEHAKIRDTHADLLKQLNEVLFNKGEDSDLKRSNANIKSDSTMGAMLQVGTTTTNYLNDNFIIPKRYIDAHRAGYIHIHDKDFSNLTFNCLQVDLQKTFKDGFKIGNSFIREPNSIRSSAALACIVLQSSQNDMFGGQSIQDFDRAMAIGVRKTFKKEFCTALQEVFDYNDIENVDEIVLNIPENILLTYKNVDKMEELTLYLTSVIKDSAIAEKCVSKAYKIACKRTEKETHQAMEAVIFNLNSMHSRAGSQVPFSSLNFGLDTSPEGRLAMEKLLLAQEAGLGHGEISIFPITVFRLKAGISYNPEDPNYDLFKLAMRVSAKRLFPNFENQDAPYNMKYYDPNDYRTEIATMGCRTKTQMNRNGEPITSSRGNFAFDTINLPLIAIEANRDIKKFYKELDKYMKLCRDNLLWRFQQISKRHVYNYPFLMGEHLWYKSETLKPEDEIGEVLKQASISIGFCGLAEALVALIGSHHGETEEARKLGYEIVSHMREMTDKFADETDLNFSLFCTPAESTAGRFVRCIQKKYGKIKGVSDREYLTNSMHVPVYYPIKAAEKIKIEAPYHELANAGVISYLEFDGDPSKNLVAFESAIRAMHDNNMNYFAINSPKDRCPSCGHTTIIDGDTCPICGYKETYGKQEEKVSIKDIVKK